MKGNIHTRFGAILIFCVFLAFSSCREEPTITEAASPELLQFSLSAEKNPLQIVYTANGSIEDNSVTVRLENILSSYVLTPTIRFKGDSVTIAKIRMDNVDHAFDFSEPQQVIVRNASGNVVLNRQFVGFNAEQLSASGAHSIEIHNGGLTLVGNFQAQ